MTFTRLTPPPRPRLRSTNGASQRVVLLAEEGDEVMDSQVRVSCGVRDDKFGEEVPAELVETGLLAEAGGRGVVEWAGSVRCVEEVLKGEIATLVQRWRAQIVTLVSGQWPVMLKVAVISA